VKPFFAYRSVIHHHQNPLESISVSLHKSFITYINVKGALQNLGIIWHNKAAGRKSLLFVMIFHMCNFKKLMIAMAL
jgi:hypothetical protein